MAAAMSLIKRERKLSRKSLTGWRAESNGGYDFQFFHADQLDMYAHPTTTLLIMIMMIDTHIIHRYMGPFIHTTHANISIHT